MTRKIWTSYPIDLTVAQAAELLGIRKRTIAKQCRNGTIPATQIDRKTWRIDRDTLRLMFFAPSRQVRQSLARSLDEIELALSTLAAIHHDTEIEGQLRTAHAAALDALNQARKEEQQ